MPTYQILRSFTVPRPEGGTYSKGIVVEMDDDEAAKYGKDVIPATIDGETVVGAMPKKAYTKAELQALIDDAVSRSVGFAILKEIEAIVAPVQGDRPLVDVIRELAQGGKPSKPTKKEA